MSASALAALVVPVLASEEETHRQLPMPAPLYGILFLLGFLLLLGLTWAFRGTAYKVRDRYSRPAGEGHPAGGGPSGAAH
ncbi:MAG: hypothetical protein ACOYBY_02520 [Dermatophilaceae bacterium]